METKEFIEHWNKLFEFGKVSIYIAENNSNGIINMTKRMKLTPLDMFIAFKEGSYKYDDAFIYMSNMQHRLYSFVNINMVKDINYNILGI